MNRGWIAVVFGALLLAGCGSGDSGDTASTSTETTSATAPAPKPKPAGKKIKTVSSQYGRVVSDSKGEALYLFTKEGGKKSQCYGDCADAWPPMLTKGEPVAVHGVTQSKLGTTTRRDGKTQVTYAGHPLYYYRDDSPGKILCQDVAEFGGSWYVVKPSGAAVT